MKPLLKIQTIPISIEYKVKRAALEMKSELPRVNVTRTPGNREIRTTLAKVKIDTFETRASAGLKSAFRSIEEYASAGRNAAMEATRNYAEGANQLLDNYGKSAIADLAASRMPQPAETIMTFIPSVPPEITVDPGSISFDYSMDKLNFDWNINHKPQMEYVPGGIEFQVTQYPEVVIEYVGSPLYVPPSSDPNYEPSSGMDVTA